jgi:hypothetical protein
VKFATGSLGTYSITFAAANAKVAQESTNGRFLTIIGEKGTIIVSTDRFVQL